MKIFILCFVIMLSGCFNKIDVQYSENDIYLYEIKNDNHESYLIIYFDKNIDNLICSIAIDNRTYTDEMVDPLIVSRFQKQYNTNIVNSSDFIATYDYNLLNNVKGYDELIKLNLYYEDELNETTLLVEYLGLSKELDDQLLYLDELLESETFKFKWIIENGIFEEYHLS